MISAVAPLRPNNIDFHLNGAELTEKRKGERIKEFCEFFVDIFNEHPYLFHETMPANIQVTGSYKPPQHKRSFPCSADNCVTDVTPPY